jgi:DNA polymerase (family 10)
MKVKLDLDNQSVAELLEAVATSLILKGGDFFRIRAYENAAEGVEHTTRDIKDIWEDNKLAQIPGVGPNIAQHLDELLLTGRVRHFERLMKGIPPSVFMFIKIPGIGPRKALKLAKGLGIANPKNAIAKLRLSAETGRIRVLETFGEDSEAAILAGIEAYEKRGNRMTLPEASRLASEMINYLRKLDCVEKIEPLGSLRRKMATIGDVDIAVASDDAKKVLKYFTKFPHKRVLGQGKNSARLVTVQNRQVDCKVVKPAKFGSLLQHFTGSKNHNIALREYAQKNNLSLSEYGIKAGGKLHTFSDEQEFYNYLNLEWIPPELRENQGEIELAKSGKQPKLVELSGIKGDLHTHVKAGWISSHDSGADTDLEMVKKAQELEYEYLALGDHNPSLHSYSEKTIKELIIKWVNHLKQLNSKCEKGENGKKLKYFLILRLTLNQMAVLP